MAEPPFLQALQGQIESKLNALKGGSMEPGSESSSASSGGATASAPTSSAPEPAVLDALKEAGVPDPQKIVDTLSAKGFEIIPTGASTGEGLGSVKPPMEPEAEAEEPEFGDELVGMPMGKARESAAANAAEKFGLGKKKPKDEEAAK